MKDKYGNKILIGDTLLISTTSWGKPTDKYGVVRRAKGKRALSVQTGVYSFYPLSTFKPKQRVIVGIGS